MQRYFWRDDGVSSVVILFRETRGRDMQRGWVGAQNGNRVHFGHAENMPFAKSHPGPADIIETLDFRFF